MPSPTASEFAFVSSSHIYLFPIVLIPAYSHSPSLFHCSLIPLDLIAFTLAHAPSSSPPIAPLPGHMHPVPDHASCAGVLSLSCNAIVVTEYGSCHGSLLLSLIPALVTNYCPCLGFSFLSRILVFVTDSRSYHGFSFLSRILVLVTDSRSCYGLMFFSRITPLVTHHCSGHRLFVLLSIISRLSLNALYCPAHTCRTYTVLPTPLIPTIPRPHTETPSSPAQRTCLSQFNLIAPTYTYSKS